MLFVSDCVPHVQRVHYQGSSSRLSNLYIRTTCNSHLRYDEDFVLLFKGEILLQGKIDRLIGIGTCYAMERNVDKTTFLLQIMVDQNKLKYV